LIKQNVTVDRLLFQYIDTRILKEKRMSLTPNSQLFSIEKQGFLSELMETMYEDRAMYKKKAIEAKKELEIINAELSKRGINY